jgi:hypothetical protein
MNFDTAHCSWPFTASDTSVPSGRFAASVMLAAVERDRRVVTPEQMRHSLMLLQGANLRARTRTHHEVRVPGKPDATAPEHASATTGTVAAEEAPKSAPPEITPAVEIERLLVLLVKAVVKLCELQLKLTSFKVR